MRIAIVVFAYNRKEKLVELFKSLEKCRTANDYDIYVYSDAGIDETDIVNVNEVRDYLEYLYKAKAFEKLNIIFRTEHLGLSNSVISGISDVLEINDAVICVEDDLILSRDFLEYMRVELQRYEKDSRIWSISGYCPKLNSLNDCLANTFLGVRASSWGWGTWKDRWSTIDWEVNDYDVFKKSYSLRKSFNQGGNDMAYLLDMQMRKMVDSWAIRWCYSQWKQCKYSVFPRETRVINNGFGENATHTKKSIGEIQAFIDDHDNSNNDIAILDCRIEKEFKEYYRTSKIKAFIKIRILNDLLGIKWKR